MSELEQATAAFMAADAAGDTQNAQILADYINNYREPVQEPISEKPAKSYSEQLMSIPELIPDAIDSFMTATEERGVARDATRKAVQEGELKPSHGSRSNLLSLSAGTAIDALAGVLTTAVKTASLLIPDAVGQPVADAFSTSATAMLTTDFGRVATEALSGKLEDWEAFKAKSPEEAKMIEGVVNVALLFTPTPKAKPSLGGLTTQGLKLEEKGRKGKIAHKRKFVDELTTPIATPQTALDDLTNTTVSGVTQRATVAKTPQQIEIAEVIANVKGVSINKTVKNNYGVLQKEVYDKADELITTLERLEKGRSAALGRGSVKGGAKALNPEVVITKLTDDVAKLIATNPLFRGDKSITGAANAMLDKTVQLLANKQTTPANIIRVRRELDAFIQSSQGKVFDAATQNSVSIPFQTIRRSLNEIVDEAVPNAGVKKSLREQTLLHNGLDVIAPKAAEEVAKISGRMVQNIQKVLPYSKTRDIWLANAVVLGATTGASINFPQLLPIMGGGLVLYGAAKQLSKQALPSRTKAGLGRLLQLTDKAIKTARDPNMIKTLRADRVYIADMLKNIKTDNNEGEEVPELLKRL
tara:strand:+ start:1191 stop:2948 length:1758 start_codon:yes stop_codon:yes gene_type:complete